MNTSDALSEFEQRVQVLRARGLVDLKFYAGEVGDSDPESFCKEANSMLQAIEQGLKAPLEFNDGTVR